MWLYDLFSVRFLGKINQRLWKDAKLALKLSLKFSTKLSQKLSLKISLKLSGKFWDPLEASRTRCLEPEQQKSKNQKQRKGLFIILYFNEIIFSTDVWLWNFEHYVK